MKFNATNRRKRKSEMLLALENPSTVMFSLFFLVGASVGDRVRTYREYTENERNLFDNTAIKLSHVYTAAAATAAATNHDDDIDLSVMIQANLPRSATSTPDHLLKTLEGTLSNFTMVMTTSQIPIPYVNENSTKTEDESRIAGITRVGHAIKGKHGGGTKKKKKKSRLQHLWKHMQKWLPNLKKIQGPSMFLLGMAQANFNNFVMHALMMSKMALISVIMMILRELVFGDKDHPVRYYNFGYEHPRPYYHHHHYRNYQDQSPVPDDYQYDYKRRRKRQSSQ